MQEEARMLFPAGRPLCLLSVLWLLGVCGILSGDGLSVRSLCGGKTAEEFRVQQAAK